jgi:hypothetical protein
MRDRKRRCLGIAPNTGILQESRSLVKVYISLDMCPIGKTQKSIDIYSKDK